MKVTRSSLTALPFVLALAPLGLIGCDSSTGGDSSGSHSPTVESSVSVTTSIEGTIQTPGSEPVHFSSKPGANKKNSVSGNEPAAISSPAPETRNWNCGIAGLNNFKPKFPENEKLVPLDKLSDGNYVLTQFSVYFFEAGRNNRPGEARLIYQLKTPGSLNPSEDFYHGLSSENNQSNFTADFFMNLQIDPSPRIIHGRLIYNPASTLHLKSIQDEKNAQLRYLSDPTFDNSSGVNPQDMFNSKRLISSNAYLIPGGIFGLADNKPLGGVLRTNTGFELYIGQMPGIWGNNGRDFTFVMTYEKPGAPSTIACQNSQSRIEKAQVQNQ
jgi:hypothetical protein